MRRALIAALAWPAVAAAHPIEPLVTGTPMPVPRDQLAAGSSYSALHGHDGTAQEVEVEVAACVGDHGEITVAGALDASEGNVSPVEVGAKILLLMEGATGLDLALAAGITTDQAAEGAIFVGRSVVPGLYLQGRLGVAGAAGAGVAGEAAAALQWAPIPRFLPTLEARVEHGFREDDDEVWVVPEAMWLLDINHLSIKLGLPIGLVGEVDVGVIVALDWQG